MPFKSLKQERWANANAGKKGGMSKAQVGEWNAASKGMKLPRSAKSKRRGR